MNVTKLTVTNLGGGSYKVVAPLVLTEDPICVLLAKRWWSLAENAHIYLGDGDFGSARQITVAFTIKSGNLDVIERQVTTYNDVLNKQAEKIERLREMLGVVAELEN